MSAIAVIFPMVQNNRGHSTTTLRCFRYWSTDISWENIPINNTCRKGNPQFTIYKKIKKWKT